ncbi:MAG: hypothetical protein WD689_06615 [Gaiellaceae bacterium]
MRVTSLGGIYLIAGIVVAAINDYFDNLGTLKRVGEAVIAVLIWPLILFGVDIDLK